MIEYFKQWKQRLSSETPDFFKPIIKFALYLGGLGGALILAGDAIPAQIHAIAGYLVAIGAVAGFIASSAKKDGIDLVDEKKIEESK